MFSAIHKIFCLDFIGRKSSPQPSFLSPAVISAVCVCTAPLASASALQPELNPTASLALFTTAAGFSESLSGSVRTEASLGKDTHLWARFSASRDEIEPVSSPNSKVTTDAGSIFVGAEGMIRKTRIGLAFATGKGRSRNKDSDAKNTFDWYGLSLYGRSVIGGFSLISDLSLSRVQNSLKEALQKPLFPSRIEQNCSVRFFFTTSKKWCFFAIKIV